MSYDRRDRVAEEIKKEVSDIVRTLKDPRIPPVFSIVRAEAARDLRTAKLYFSVLGGAEEQKMCADALKSANGLIRRELGNRLKTHHTPELTFISDDSIAYSAHISGLIDKLNLPQPKDEGHEGAGDT